MPALRLPSPNAAHATQVVQLEDPHVPSLFNREYYIPATLNYRTLLMYLNMRDRILTPASTPAVYKFDLIEGETTT